MQPDFMTETNILASEPAEIYHAKSKEFLSSHQLLDFIKCPLFYVKKQMGMIEDKDSSAYLLGRGAHTRILEGRDVYEKSYALGGPINPKTGKPYGSSTKMFEQWQAEQYLPVISHSQVELIEQMASGLETNAAAVELLASGKCEGVARADYLGVPSQIRIDWLNPTAGIVDLKTCLDIEKFEYDAKKYRYHNQMAFYREVLRLVCGKNAPVYIIAIEKSEPFRCGVWLLSQKLLNHAKTENEIAIERLKDCIKTNNWPTGYEQMRFMDIA